ncbi:MAG: sigma-70 family RNA polymerase sigma factor [Planctomycetota bacterium]
MDRDSERRLVEQATAGDPPSVAALLNHYLPRVRAYLRLRAGPALLDKESASDLAQSVCRDVLENLERFRYDGEDGFRRWLFKTAQRKVLDRHAYYGAKKRDLPQAAATDLDATLACYGELYTPSRDAIAREELARLEQAIESLPDEVREVVILAKVVGLSRKAIAQETGKSEGAIRMALHRGLARLADKLARESG